MRFTFFLLVWLSTAVTSSLFSQAQNFEKCGKDQYLEERLKNDPAFAKKFKEWTTMSKNVVDPLSRAAIGCTGANSVIVPVAVHYNAPINCDNFTCLVTMAQAQIDVLNEDFGATNADLSYYTSTLNGICPVGYPLSYAATGGGSCIQFCLATMNHPSSSGLVNGDPAITVGDYTWDTTNGDWSGYLNIFVSSGTTAGLGSTTLGISPFPGSANGDGFFCGHDYFGAPGVSCTSGAALNTGAPYNLGRTATHEAGHYFGLDHTFSGGCADSDSNPPGAIAVNDTPPQSSSSGGCPNVTDCNSAPTSCTPAAYTPFYNYMDYSNDACLVMFTENQSSVINYWANLLSWANNATVCGTINTGVPIPEFTPASGAISLCPSETQIEFLDGSSSSCGQSITGWMWTFSGAGVSPTSSTMQNPTVTVSSSGTLTTTLTLTSGATTSTPTTENISVTILPATDPSCIISPCTSWAAGPFSNLSNGSLCFTPTQTINSGVQVLGNYAFTLDGLDANVNYNLEFCNGYSATNWGADAIITICEYSIVGGAFTPGTVLAFTAGCSIDFKPSISGNYMAIISSDGNCGGAVQSVNNGSLTLTASNCYSCGNDFSDKFGSLFLYSSNLNDTYEICPDKSIELLSITFTEFNIQANGNNCPDELSVYAGTGTSNLIGSYCGDLADLQSINGGVFEATDFGECLTFVFTSNGNTELSGWFADISCCTCSLTGTNYSSTGCGIPVPQNTGGPISTTVIDNTCTQSSMSLTDLGLTYIKSEVTAENRSIACPITAASPNQTFFAVQCDSDGVASEQLEIAITDINTGGNIDVALYGPVTGSAPNYSGGSFVAGACSTGTGTLTVSALANDNEVYIVVISTQNKGRFSLESTANAVALPVELLDLSAVANRSNIKLSWATASELNNSGFEILRSMDAQTFEVIGWVEGLGNNNSYQEYKYVDSKVNAGQTYYYKLNQIDFDGKQQYSKTVFASLEATQDVSIYPNPSTGVVFVEGVFSQNKVEYTVFDKLGKKVKSGFLNEETRQIDATQFENGVYHLLIQDGDINKSKTMIVIK